MSERENYDLLVKESDAAYASAGVALRERNFSEYKRHVDAAWAAMGKAKPIFERLPRDEQMEIIANAYKGLATAFVRGLGSRAGQ